MDNETQFNGQQHSDDATHQAEVRGKRDDGRKGRALLRLAEIEDQIRSGRPLKFRREHPEDRLQAALRLSQWVEKAHKTGVSRAKIVDRLDELSKNRPRLEKKLRDFRLQRWLLPRRITEITPEVLQEFKKRPEPFKDVAVYLAISEALAMELQGDPTQFKIDILRNTNLWNKGVTGVEPTDSADAEPQRMLALKLSKFARHLAHITDLPSLLRRAERVPGIWEPYLEEYVTSYRGKPTNFCVDTSSPVAPYGCSYDESNLPPFPSLPLVRVPYVIVDGPLWLEIEGRNTPLDHWRARGPDADCEVVEGRVIIYREIRLALAPVSSVSPGEIGAVFESRAHIEVRLDTDDDRTGRYPLLTPQSADASAADIPVADFSAQIDVGGWRRVMFSQNLAHWSERCVARFPDYPMSFDAEPVARPGAPDDECWYFTYTLADTDHVRHWLLEDRRLQDEPAVSLWEDWKREQVFTWAADPRLPARHIEAALHSNAIEDALTQKIERLRASLEAREAAWRTAATAATEDLLARWQSAEAPSSGDVEQ